MYIYIYALQKIFRSANLLSHLWHILWSPLASMPFGMQCIALLRFDGIPCSIRSLIRKAMEKILDIIG